MQSSSILIKGRKFRDYRIDLIAPEELSETDLGKFKTDLREVMRYIKYSTDKQKLLELVESDEKFSHMDQKTAMLLSECTHSRLKLENLEGEVNMCKAIKELREDSWNDGWKDGWGDGQKQGVLSSIRALMKNLGLTAEQAMEALDIPSTEHPAYQEQI